MRRRRSHKLLTAVLVAFAAGCAAVVLCLTLPAVRRALMAWDIDAYKDMFRDRLDGKPYSGDYDGIDVSKHNGTILWDRVARDGRVRFVFIKATEGSGHADRRYRRNLEGARAVGLKVGSYHFLTSKTSVQRQFAHFLEVARPDEQDLIPVLDVEEGGIRGRWTGAQLRDSVERFSLLVKKHYGKRPIIYSNVHFYNTHLAPDFNRHLLFMASYDALPRLSGKGKVNVWQRTERGHLPGIGEYVDLDVLVEGTTVSDLTL